MSNNKKKKTGRTRSGLRAEEDAGVPMQKVLRFLGYTMDHISDAMNAQLKILDEELIKEVNGEDKGQPAAEE